MIDFNYGEYIFQQLIMSEFIQQKLAYILISMCANLINIHIVSIICYILSIHPYIDFIIQICISIFMALHIEYVYLFLKRYNPEFFELTQYLIKNFTIEKYRYWKRIVVICFCIYICILLLFIKVDNRLIYIYIIQYAITFIITEQFEQRRIQTWLKHYKEQPKIHKYSSYENALIDSYYSNNIKHK
jgi:hypothetical protein